MLLFVYTMSQVRKYQSGGVTPKEDLLIDIGGVKYLKSDVVGIFKNQLLRDRYSKEFLGNDSEQDALFNEIADIYADGLDSGKMRFDSDGHHIIDPSGKYYNIDRIIEKPKTKQDYFNNQSVRVMNMFEIARSRGYIASWESKIQNKDDYDFDERKVITTNYFNKPSNYDWANLDSAWYALDPMNEADRTRKSDNRRKILSSAIIKEADKIDNDPAYRKKYKFDGELTNPLAYKDYTKLMREYANLIANSDKFDERMLEIGTRLGVNPRLLYQQGDKDTDSLFSNITAEALQLKADQEKKAQQDKTDADNAQKAKATEDAKKLAEDVQNNGIIRNIDPLSTKDIQFVENNGIYTITDNISGISPFGQQIANRLQAKYGREQIQKNWYGWQQYAGKYLENLTNYFTNKTGYRIYAMTNGPLSHSKKIFFAKKPSDKKPIQIQFKKVGVDYHIFDMKGNELANLGTYGYDSVRRLIQSDADYEDVLKMIFPTPLSKDYDTGEPIPFNSKEVFTKDGILAYWQALLNIKYDEYDARRFEEILKGVSMQFLSLPQNDQYKYNAFNVSSNPRSWHGTRFALYVNNDGHVVFSWIYGNNELAFVSKVTKEEFIKKYLKKNGNTYYIDYGFINQVAPQRFNRNNGNNVDIIGYKFGGKLRKHSTGGSLFDTYKSQMELGIIQKPLDVAPVQTVAQPQKEQKEEQLAKQPEEFTVADGVRLGASILDLTGAFMLFPKGLNVASAAVSGASLIGYIGADLADVVAGKKELWPTLKHDAEIAGVQAIALVNPVKAGQIAPALAKIVPMVPHIAGLLWTYDILADDYSRKSIMETLDKVQKMKVSEINSQDLTNLAFIARTLIGAKMGVKTVKNKATKGVKKITNKALQVDDVPYQVKVKSETNPSETILRSDILQVRKGSGKQKQSDKIADIKKQVVEDYNAKVKEGEQKITIEDVEILDKPNGNPIKAQVYKFNFKDPVDIMSESWAPGRLFETAVQHGTFDKGYVTRKSTWLGKQLREALGEDFDVWFSDEALYRSKQERAVNNLAHNLFGGINEIKNLAQKISELKETEQFKQATEVQQEQIMSDFLAQNGYIYKPQNLQETQIYEGALNKANEIIEVSNNLNSMTDIEAASRILGVDNIESATKWEGISPDNYITSEMLRKAYSLFREVYDSNSPVAQAARVSDTQMLVENFADQFNGRPLESAWKQNDGLTREIQTNLTKFQNIASQVDRTFKERYEALHNPTEQRAFILSEARKLLDSGKLSQSDYELIQNTQNLIRNSKADDIFKVAPEENNSPGVTEEPQAEPVNTTKQQRQLSLDLETQLYKTFTQEQLNSIRKMSEEEFNKLSQSLSTTQIDLLKQYRNLPKEAFQSDEIIELNKQKQNLAENRTNAFTNLSKLEVERKRIKKHLEELEENFNKAGGQEKLNSLKEELNVLKEVAKNVSDGQPTVLDEGIHNLEAKIDKLEKAQSKIKDTKRQTLKTISDELAAEKELERVEKENSSKFTELHNKVKKLESRLEQRKSLRQQAHDEYTRLKVTLSELEKQTSKLKQEFNKKLKTLSKNPQTARILKSEVNKFNRELKAIEVRIRKTENDLREAEAGIQNYNEVLLNKRGGIMDFVNNALISKLQSGGYLKVGNGFSSAIQPNFQDPYGQGWNEYVGSWYDQIGSRQLPGMLELLAQNEDWLGNSGVIAQLNRDKATLDTKWDTNHKSNNGAYWGSNVGDYQRRISFDPITTAISNAYGSGRYMLRTNNPSSGEYKLKDDNFFSAITHDAVAFGNVKWLSDQNKQHYLKLLKSLVGDKYKFITDQNGYIYPVSANETELGDGESWFYTNDTVDDNGNVIETTPTENQQTSPGSSTETQAGASGNTGSTGSGATGSGAGGAGGAGGGRSGSNPDGDILPAKSKNPNINKTWIDLATLFAGQLGTIDARNQIKFRTAPQKTYNLVDRVVTGNNAQKTTREYASLFGNAPTSSDARYNTAVKLNIASNYVKALQEAYDKDRAVFYESSSKADQTQKDNIKRQYDTYNTNLKEYTDQLKYQDNLNYMERQKLWQNVSNLLTTKATDIENANKLRTSKYFEVYNNKIEQQRAQKISDIKLEYWNALSADEKAKYGNSMSTYLSSTEFRTAYGDAYDKKIDNANKIADENIRALIDGLYSINPTDITYKKTYGSDFKEGGRIVMAKKGSNLNWAKIENARMVNKSINESIKETYKSIRSANRELQKTIRALAPMLKALNT